MNYDTITEPMECEVIVATADIAGFTGMCRDRSEQEVFKILDEFYELVGDVVHGADGKVVKFMGDSELIIFPAGKAREVNTALRGLQTQAQEIWSDFHAKCRVRIDAHIGIAVCGPLGTAGDKRFDVTGNTVNELFLMPHPELFNLSD
jgi:class 3 adenylate cyclase